MHDEPLDGRLDQLLLLRVLAGDEVAAGIRGQLLELLRVELLGFDALRQIEGANSLVNCFVRRETGVEPPAESLRRLLVSDLGIEDPGFVHLLGEQRVLEDGELLALDEGPVLELELLHRTTAR
jgi:hypothetical protein